MEEIPLDGGDLSGVVRVGETVRRPMGSWSPAVHALLDHFERVGLFIHRRNLGYEAHRLWGGIERRPGWKEMWDAGSGELMRANMGWIEANRPELESWL